MQDVVHQPYLGSYTIINPKKELLWSLWGEATVLNPKPYRPEIHTRPHLFLQCQQEQTLHRQRAAAQISFSSKIGTRKAHKHVVSQSHALRRDTDQEVDVWVFGGTSAERPRHDVLNDPRLLREVAYPEEAPSCPLGLRVWKFRVYSPNP